MTNRKKSEKIIKSVRYTERKRLYTTDEGNYFEHNLKKLQKILYNVRKSLFIRNRASNKLLWPEEINKF